MAQQGAMFRVLLVFVNIDKWVHIFFQLISMSHMIITWMKLIFFHRPGPGFFSKWTCDIHGVWIEAAPITKISTVSKGTQFCLRKSLIIMFPVRSIWFQDSFWKCWVRSLIHLSYMCATIPIIALYAADQIGQSSFLFQSSLSDFLPSPHDIRQVELGI